eukprot:503862-Prymnesium_polylepis.1
MEWRLEMDEKVFSKVECVSSTTQDGGRVLTPARLETRLRLGCLKMWVLEMRSGVSKWGGAICDLMTHEIRPRSGAGGDTL